VLRIIRNVLVVIVMGLLGWYAIGRIIDHSAVRRLEARVRKQGEPLTVAELIATLPNVPEEENAAIKLIAIWAKDNPEYWHTFLAGGHPEVRQVAEKYDPELPYLGKKMGKYSPGQKLSEASFAALESYVERQSNHLHEVRRALDAPRARFPIRFAEAYDALLPHLPALKTEAQRFRLQGLQRANAGDVNGALESIHDILRLGETLKDEATFISQLVGANCIGLAVNSVEDLFSRQELSSEQLQALEKLFQPIATRKMQRISLISERVLILHVFTDPASVASSSEPEMPSPAQARKGMKFFSAIGLAAADRKLVLETLEQIIAISKDTSTNAFRRAKIVEDSFAQKSDGFPPKIFSGLLLPGALKSTPRFTALEARVQALKIACAVERYRIRDARLPDSLGALVPDYLSQVPLDPFDAQPFRYRPSGARYVVYSVGPDLTDNHGISAPKDGPGDETFTVNR
jgi:hypothetical protein